MMTSCSLTAYAKRNYIKRSPTIKEKLGISSAHFHDLKESERFFLKSFIFSATESGGDFLLCDFKLSNYVAVVIAQNW